LNPKYVAIVKQDIKNLLVVGFIKPFEEATWLSLIMVVPKKDEKLRIYVAFKKLNATTKKDPYPLPFIDKVINMVARHEVYTFMVEFSGYHQISSVTKYQHKKTFITD